MDDPVKGEGRMITDASGVTRRKAGFWECGAIYFQNVMVATSKKVIAHRAYPTSGIFLIFSSATAGKAVEQNQ